MAATSPYRSVHAREEFWRLKTCEFPPLRLNFSGETSKGSIFHKLDKPKLVSYCQDNDGYEQYILQEFQLYRIYQLLTPVSHKARLLKLTYADSGSGKVRARRYGFVIEEPKAIAARLGGKMLEQKGAVAGDLDPDQNALLGVFQYMIGNTDFSVAGLHNVELFFTADGDVLPIAYDFDFAGAVNARYAVPDEKLSLPNVRQRLFRGYCNDADSYAKVFALFKEKKPEIYALYSDEIGKLMDQGTVKETLRYFDEFYETINDPRSARRSIINPASGARKSAEQSNANLRPRVFRLKADRWKWSLGPSRNCSGRSRVRISQRSKNLRSAAARYALALVATAVALVATLALRRYGPTPSFLFFVPAVAVAAWYGGRGPSALATALSLLLIDLNFLAPDGSLSIDRVEGLEIIAFIVVAATITTTMDALHRALALAESRAAELKVLNDEVARSYDAEREKRHDAELLAHAREDVLGLVAHDLRNPLNLIITTADLLLEEKLDPARQHELLEVAMRAGKQMNRLIGDLLDTVRLQAGKFSLDLEDVPVASIFQQAAESFLPAAEKREIRLDISPPGDGMLVRADPLRVAQLVSNIVGNAIKFTPEKGSVTLKAAPDGNRLVVKVSDTGPGIPPSDIPHLFDTFWQARSNRSPRCRAWPRHREGVVEAHGGKIWCESTVGVGSTFSFTLPIANNGRSAY